VSEQVSEVCGFCGFHFPGKALPPTYRETSIQKRISTRRQTPKKRRETWKKNLTHYHHHPTLSILETFSRATCETATIVSTPELFRPVIALFVALLLWLCCLIPDHLFALLVRVSPRFLTSLSRAHRFVVESKNCSLSTSADSGQQTQQQQKQRKHKKKRKSNRQHTPEPPRSSPSIASLFTNLLMAPRRRSTRNSSRRGKQQQHQNNSGQTVEQKKTTAALLADSSPLSAEKRAHIAAALAELTALDNAYNMLRPAGPRRTRHNQVGSVSLL
jgi:hypothetical protein